MGPRSVCISNYSVFLLCTRSNRALRYGPLCDKLEGVLIHWID